MSLANEMGGLRFVSFYDAKIDEFKIDKDEGQQWDALLRYHFKIDPTGLSDNEYFKLVAQLAWVIEQENNKYKNQD